MSEELAVRSGAGRAIGRTGLVWVSGPDAVSFLDGLLSQNIAALEVGGGARSLLLAPNGKLRAILWLHRQRDRIGLLADAGRTAAVAGDLSRFRIRVDVDLNIEAASVHDIWGPGAGEVAATAAAGGAVLAAPYPLQRSSFQRFVVVGHEPTVAQMAAPVVEALRIAEGEAVSGVDVDDKTIPQEALDVSTAVDFAKGCYLGQELVARIDSRGRVNRRLVGLIWRTSTVPVAGESVIYEGNSVGTISSTAWSDLLDAPIALGMVRREVEEGAKVATDSGEATVVPLPIRR
jgi:folate-binding protein YgfZ